MRVSVVINTYNRASSLRTTLDALRHQTHRDFEVVVVDGPSTDATPELLAERAGAVRAVDCPERNLSKSRNLGIDAAAGDVVAFIDDDAVPEPRWLEDLVAAYDADAVGGAGGVTLDHTGVQVQYRHSVCNRIGLTDFGVTPPFDAYNRPGADPYLYLQGTNASFRRAALERIGGFDEEIEYNYDESEVCLQVIDAGFELRSLTGAVVHHKFLPSHMRREAGFFTDPYLPIKNRAYFVLRNGRATYGLDAAFASLTKYFDELMAWAGACLEDGRFTRAEYDHFVERLRAGYDLGVERGLAGVRKGRPIAPRDPGAFLPYPVLEPAGRRLGVCFVSLDYPPGPFGGIARFTNDLARGFAARGHDVCVVTQAEGQYRVDFEDGVWVHRYPYSERWLPALGDHPLVGNLAHLAAAYRAVDRVLERMHVDVVSGPLWIAEPLFCAFDPRAQTAMTCMTPMRVIAETQPALAEREHSKHQIRLEDAALTRVDLLQPVSHANLETLRRLVPAARDVPAEVVWHGVDDRRPEFPRTRAQDDGAVEVLFVGRLEPRKGVDTLLEAAIDLVRERPHLRVRLAGADTGASTEGGRTYADWLGARLAGEPATLGRFHFEGEVSDETLYRLYADCDVFCAPSRYESFGLVLAEAQMMGRPVVACDAGGMPEVVADGETGLLVEPGDVAGLRAALAALVDDPARRAATGAAARVRFEREFHNDVAVTRTLELYDRMAAARDGAEPPPAELAAEAVERGVAELLGELLGLDPSAAEEGAAQLLDPIAFPVDYEAGLARLHDLDDEAFIRGVYALILDREPEAVGMTGYRAALAAGGPRAEVVRSIARSDEATLRGVATDFLARLAISEPRDAERMVRTVWTVADDDAFVTGVHAAILGSPPSQSARAAALRSLRAGGSRRALLEELLDEAERTGQAFAPRSLLAVELVDRDRLLTELPRLARLAPREFVDGVYRLLLGRAPDKGGLQGAVARLEGRTPPEEIIRFVAESAEAQARGLERSWLPEAMAAVRDARRHPVVRRLRAVPAIERTARRGRKVIDRAKGDTGTARRLGTMIGELAATVTAESRRLEERIDGLESVTGRVAEAQRSSAVELSGRLDATTARLNQETQILGDHLGAQLRDRVGDLEARLAIMGKKHDAVAMDLRERVPPRPEAADLPAPVIVDPDAYDRRVEEIGALRVNLGCGEKPLDGYVNVDFRPLPGVDVVADVRRLPFEAGTVDEVASAHLVEHFRQHQLETLILPYWRSLLAPDGAVRIVCPNWAVMIEQLNAGELAFDDFKTVTFGLQDYSGDDHFAMYTPTTLTAVLERAGFGRIEVLEERRQNGNSPEMELLAHPIRDQRPAPVESS